MRKMLSSLVIMTLVLLLLPLHAALAAVSITVQPKDVAVNKGETATVTLKATGDGLKYAWYYRNAGESKFTYTDSFDGNTYSITMNAERDGRQVYCVVTDKNGGTVQSTTVTLSMKASTLKITKQPSSVVAEEGKAATVTVKASGDGLTYQWYYAAENSKRFEAASIKTATYSVIMTEERAGRKIYCVITDKYGNQTTTETVSLKMATPLRITAQPKNAVAIGGNKVEVKLVAEGEGLTYQWYYKDKEAKEFEQSSVTTDTYSVIMITERAGRQVYCVVTDQFGNQEKTNTVTLDMATVLKIKKQPESALAPAETEVVVTVEAQGDELTYQWYYADKGSEEFRPASIKKDTYTVPMSASRDGRRVYCVITDKYGETVQSKTVTLTMAKPLKIIKQPENTMVAADETATVTVQAQGEGLTYQWYYADEGTGDFVKSSCQTEVYVVEMTKSRSGRQVHCLIMDQYGNYVISETVTIGMVLQKLELLSQPNDAVYARENQQAEIAIEAVGDDVTYTWYYKDVADEEFRITGTFTGNVYSLTMASKRDGRQVYCVIKDKHGYEVVTDTFTFTMLPNDVYIAAQPEDASGYIGMTVSATVEAYGDGLTYQWFTKTAADAGFVKTDCTDTTYSITMSESLAGLQLYCLVMDEHGDVEATNTVTFYRLVGNYQDTLKFDVRENEIAIIGYMGTPDVVHIPAEIEGMPVTIIAEEAFYGCSSLKEVHIPGKVTTIGQYAFASCNNLTTVVIPSSVKSIGAYAFYQCAGLTEITIPKRVVKIGEGVFGSCTGLEKVTINGKVTSIGKGAFAGCVKLTDITLPANVKTINASAFENCAALRAITLPDNVQTIGKSAFAGCAALENITIPGNVTTIGDSAFARCAALISVKIETGVTADDNAQQDGTLITVSGSYKTIGASAFAGCTALTNITIPGNVTGIGESAFMDCANLNSVKLEEGLTTIGASAFMNCKNLPAVTFPESLTDIGARAFAGCEKLTKITVPAGVLQVGGSAFENCVTLMKASISGTDTAVAADAFKGCTNLSSVSSPATLKIAESSTIDLSLLGIFKDVTVFVFPEKVTSITSELTSTKVQINVSYPSKTIACFQGRGEKLAVTVTEGTKKIAASAFSGCTGLVSIDIPEGVTEIGANAFTGCTGLKSILLPESVTKIAEHAFSGCTSLKEIAIPDAVKTIGASAFAGCNGLTQMTIPENVKTVGAGAFMDCSALTNVLITSSKTTLDASAFDNCSTIERIDAPETLKLSGESVDLAMLDQYAGMQHVMFSDTITSIVGTLTDKKLTVRVVYPSAAFDAMKNTPNSMSVTVANGVTSLSLSNDDYISDFRDVTNLVSVTLSETLVELSQYAFSGCTDLTKVTIPASVKEIGYAAFSGCTALETVTFNGAPTEIGAAMFYGCTSLKSISIPDSVTEIGYDAFARCTALKEIKLPAGVQEIGSGAFAYCTALTEVTVPNSVTKLRASMFKGCTGLKKVVLPESVTEISADAFAYCTGLTDITIPKNVAKISSGTFYGCSALTNITLPEGVTDIGSEAFANCISLQNVVIPQSVHYVNLSAFSGCTAMTGLTIPAGVEYVEGALKGADLLIQVTYPSAAFTFLKNSSIDIAVTIAQSAADVYGTAERQSPLYHVTNMVSLTIPDGTEKIGNYAFYGCSGLKNISIPESVREIGDYAFWSCSELTGVTLPDGLEKIGANAFAYCFRLNSITLPENVAVIGEAAFSHCMSLKSIVLPESIRKIDASAFEGCTGLTEITLPAGAEIGFHVLYGCTKLSSISVAENSAAHQWCVENGFENVISLVR